MAEQQSTAMAHPNIAFIKYWGNRDNSIRLPENGSISMNLDGLETRTHVRFSSSLKKDTLNLNTKNITGAGLERVTCLLDIVRSLSRIDMYAEVVSENNFPTGAGIASSAAAFAALSLAASRAAGLALTETQLSRLARRGSGSACRSVPGGFCEWLKGTSDNDSYAVSIAAPDHWDLADCIAVIQGDEKKVGSTEGHATAASSPLQDARVAGAENRLARCRNAILTKDFASLAEVVELDSNMMHGVMMTSNPVLFYWDPLSLSLMKEIPEWRKAGLQVCYTLDAGPNIHAICTVDSANIVADRLTNYPGVKQVLKAGIGGPASFIVK
jgi:diphosphomevalonate decarboxylase